MTQKAYAEGCLPVLVLSRPSNDDGRPTLSAPILDGAPVDDCGLPVGQCEFLRRLQILTESLQTFALGAGK